MKILFFDTETTGFTNNGPLEQQPHIVQIGAILGNYEKDGSMISQRNIDLLFNPGIPIPANTTAVHGITDEKVKYKLPISSYMKDFIRMTKEADFICGHNVQFDRRMIFIEVDRIRKKESAEKIQWKKDFIKKEICTMNTTAEFVGIKMSFGKYKPPKLIELHQKLFDKGFENAHNAFGDIEATRDCFFELQKRGILSL